MVSPLLRDRLKLRYSHNQLQIFTSSDVTLDYMKRPCHVVLMQCTVLVLAMGPMALCLTSEATEFGK